MESVDRDSERLRLMTEELEQLKRENYMLRLQQKISDLEHEIDRRSLLLPSSTPAYGYGHSSVVQGPQLKTEGITPMTYREPKPRRLLPSTPKVKKSHVDQGNQTNLSPGESPEPDRFVTVRKKSTDFKPESYRLGKDAPVKVKPATYDACSSWTDYKAHFEACATLNGWSDEQRGLYLSVSLRGQAQGVLGNLTQKTTDYKELVRALEDRFAPPNQTELYRVQLRDRRQKATESMAELGQDIRRLASLAYPSAPSDVKETLAKEQFVDALVNSDMRLKIKQSRPISLNDAVRHAVELEAFYRAEKSTYGTINSIMAADSSLSKEMDELKKTVFQIQNTLDRVVRESGQEKPINKQPYSGRGLNNCRRNRYIQKGQPKGYVPSMTFSGNRHDRSKVNESKKQIQTCYRCGSEGHLNRDCQSQREDYVFSIRTNAMPKTKRTPEGNPLKVCSGCKEVVKGKLSEHLQNCRNIQDTRIPCNMCSKTFKRAAYARRHVKTVHGSNVKVDSQTYKSNETEHHESDSSKCDRASMDIGSHEQERRYRRVATETSSKERKYFVRRTIRNPAKLSQPVTTH